MLLDTNVLIYAAKDAHPEIRAFVEATAPFVSAISIVEALGYQSITPGEEILLRRFIGASVVLPVSDAVIEGAVALRQRRRMSLGDALIAATALAHGLALVTRNAADFGWIDGLALVNPFDA